MAALRPSRLGAAALFLALARPATAAAPPIDADAFGWWIYAGSVRSTLVSRYLGPQGLTPGIAAASEAARACRLPLKVDRLDAFAETPVGDDPLTFGPWVDRRQVASALACVRRYVPAAFVMQALPPS